jgi:hypothetical protein
MARSEDPSSSLRAAVKGLMGEAPETLILESPFSDAIRTEAQELHQAGFSGDEVAEIVGAEMLRIVRPET